MVLDTLTNLPSYNALNSHFAKVCAYLKEAHLSGLPEGRYPIDGDNAYLMISERDLKKPADAALEVHDRYIDIQIVLSGREGFGWKDRSRCAAPRGAMNTEKDVMFYDDEPSTYFTLGEGEIGIFFPPGCACAVGGRRPREKGGGQGESGVTGRNREGKPGSFAESVGIGLLARLKFLKTYKHIKSW